MIWPFGSAIKATSGIFDAEGFFRTGRRPAIGQPLAEIHSLADVDEDPQEWCLKEQQKLSRVALWRDDYFQYWAEALAFGEAGRGWLMVPAA